MTLASLFGIECTPLSADHLKFYSKFPQFCTSDLPNFGLCFRILALIINFSLVFLGFDE